MRFKRSAPKKELPSVETPAFEDPFPDDSIDNRELLRIMGCTMQYGILKTAIEKVTEGTRPAIAREVMIGVLSVQYGASDQDNIHRFVNSAISPEVVAAGQENVDKYSDGSGGLVNNLKFMPYRRGEGMTLEQTTNDPEVRERTIKQSLEAINQFIFESYVEVVTPEVRQQFADRYEDWRQSQ